MSQLLWAGHARHHPDPILLVRMVTWPQLASRNAGKCNHPLCPRRGNRTAELMAGTFTDWLNAWMLSCIWLFMILCTVVCQGFSRQEYWSGLPCPPPGSLPYSGIKPLSPVSPSLQADSSPLSHRGIPIYFFSLLGKYFISICMLPL